MRQAKPWKPNVATAAALATARGRGRPSRSGEACIAAAKAAPAPGAIPKFEIPVHIRFMRTSGSGSVGSSMLDHDADFGTHGGTGGHRRRHDAGRRFERGIL